MSVLLNPAICFTHTNCRCHSQQM